MNVLSVLFFFLSLSVPALASGPNYNDTTQLLVVPNTSGDVGIGTITPQGALVVTNGNVGIGTWAPADVLQVGKYSANSSGFEVDSNGNVGIGTINTSNAALTVQSGNVGIGTSSASALLQLGAGTSSTSPLILTPGTNLTVATVGAVEYDGTAPYFSAAASSRGVLPAVQFISQSSAYTLISQTAAQPLFNSVSTPNGAVTVQGSTTYLFECFFSLTAMSGSSGNFGFQFGGNSTISSQAWESLSTKAASFIPGNTFTAWHYNTAADAAMSLPGTGTFGQATLWGIVRIGPGGGGTFIPEVTLTVAAPAIVGTNSYFRIWPVGSNAVQSQGDWS